MPHTYTSILLHVVFATKERMPLIDADLESRLYPYLGGIIRYLGGTLCLVNGVADHVHLLTEVPARSSIADVLRRVKSSSSKWVHETFPSRRRFEWQRGYAAFSVSRSNAGAVGRYIERQKEHHARTTFRDEFVRLLERHGVAIDERFLWT